MPEQPTEPASEQTGKDVETPRGTLAIMLIFGTLFALAWLATYFLLFLGRGAPHH